MPRINELFDLEYGHSLELNRLAHSTASDAVNFVSRAARNNGVTARVRPIPRLEPAPAGTITVALNGQGGAGVAFLQPYPYYCGFHVMVLTPRLAMSEPERLWWALCITANRFRFGFGRQANRSLKDLVLPDPKDIPSWVKSADVSMFDGGAGPRSAAPQPPLDPFVRSRRNPATRSRHIPATWCGAQGHLEGLFERRYFAVVSESFWGLFSRRFAMPVLDAGATFGSRYDGPSSSRQ